MKNTVFIKSPVLLLLLLLLLVVPIVQYRRRLIRKFGRKVFHFQRQKQTIPSNATENDKFFMLPEQHFLFRSGLDNISTIRFVSPNNHMTRNETILSKVEFHSQTITIKCFQKQIVLTMLIMYCLYVVFCCMHTAHINIIHLSLPHILRLFEFHAKLHIFHSVIDFIITINKFSSCVLARMRALFLLR